MLDTTEFEIIPLETNKECLIAEVTMLFCRNNKIIVFDETALGAYIFNRDGSFHSRIRAIGQGPGEYPAKINDIYASENYIYVLAPPFGIMQYDYESNFIRKIDLQDTWGMNIMTEDDRSLLVVNDWSTSRAGCFRLFKLNPETNSKQTFQPFPQSDYDNHRGWSITKYYAYNKDNILLYYGSIDTIFEYRDEAVVPKYAIDVVHRGIPEDLKTGDGYTALTTSIKNKYIKGVRDVAETSRFLFIQVDMEYILVYDKVDKEVKALSYAFMNKGTKALQIERLFSMDKNHVMIYYTGLRGYNDKGLFEDEKIPLESRFDREYVKKIASFEDEEENPIVIILKVKE